jgi:hypothetical protein
MGDSKQALDQLRVGGDKNPTPDQTRVIVVLSGKTDGTTELLNSYAGVRVYDRGAVDPRVTMGHGPLPVFTRWADCESYLLEQPGKRRPCLLTHVEAQKVFSEEWADFTPQADQ